MIAGETVRELLIALHLAADLPRSALCALATHLATAGELPRGPSAARAAGVGPDALAAAGRALTARTRAAEEERSARRLGARLVTRVDEEYPPPLLELPLPPAVLMVAGELPPRPAIAVVGSRQASAYGLEAAELFARELAARGVAIVSGFARGVDAAAHRGALAAPGGRTVAVLGCGLDVDYPQGHEKLKGEIAARGAVVTELPLGTDPYRSHFPIRNRIIAALATGTLVVEATARSGSLITARHALDLGREVYAVPGRIFDARAQGPNALLRDGAVPALHPEDILGALPLADREGLAPARVEAPPAAQRPAGPSGALFAALTDGPASAEELAAMTRLSIDQVLGLLLELELGGHVRRSPGALYTQAGSLAPFRRLLPAP